MPICLTFIVGLVTFNPTIKVQQNEKPPIDIDRMFTIHQL